MKQTARAALFCSLLLMTGMVLGLLITFLAREYANRKLEQSRRYRNDDPDPSPNNNVIEYEKLVK